MILLKKILEVLEHFVRFKMTKVAKRRCRRFLSNENQLILYIISEYNCYEARKGTNYFITFKNYNSDCRGGMCLITNPSELRLSENDNRQIASEIKNWLMDFYKQEQAVEEAKHYEQNRSYKAQ